MRFLYGFLLYLMLPFIFLRLLWRSRRLPDYKTRVGERLGFFPFTLENCIWVHAVSVGEVIAAAPFIKLLQTHYPTTPLLVTTMTPTGAARVKSMFGESLHHCYLPYDFPFAMRRFFNAMNPKVGLIIETEMWPNLLAIAKHKQIPMCLLNARLSAKSAKGYARVASITKSMLSSFVCIAAVSKADAERFVELGAIKESVFVTGNIKFDLQIPTDLNARKMLLQQQLGENRFIWIAASTHAGEEEQVLAAHKQLLEKNPQALLILVPRHPDRFNEVAALCERQGFSIARRSQNQLCTSETKVYLADTMGEMLLMYSVSDAAFVGGSLIANGGHNILEPAALGKPILSGTHLFNFAEISQLFLRAQALIVVEDANSLALQLINLQDPHLRTQMGTHALQVMVSNRGALERQWELVNKVLNV